MTGLHPLFVAAENGHQELCSLLIKKFKVKSESFCMKVARIYVWKSSRLKNSIYK